MRAVIEQGRYFEFDAPEIVSKYIVNDIPDEARFLEFFDDLFLTAREAPKRANPRISFFGECAPLLVEQGKTDLAMQVEKIVDTVIKIHGVDLLCGYALNRIEDAMDSDTCQQICEQHWSRAFALKTM